MQKQWYQRNWRKFFFRLTCFASLGGGLIRGIDILDEPRYGQAGLLVFLAGFVSAFLTVWVLYLICWCLFLIGKWIYRGLDDR